MGGGFRINADRDPVIMVKRKAERRGNTVGLRDQQIAGRDIAIIGTDVAFHTTFAAVEDLKNLIAEICICVRYSILNMGTVIRDPNAGEDRMFGCGVSAALGVCMRHIHLCHRPP